MLRTFSTKAANRLERSRQWCAATRAEQVVFEDDRPASLRGGEFGAIQLCLAAMGRHRVIQSSPAESLGVTPRLKFLFQDEGSATVRQGGRANTLQAGQWCAIRKDLGFEIDAPAFSRQFAITVPCETLPGPRRGTDWWRQPRSFQRGPAQILHACASATLMADGLLADIDREQMGAQLADLLAMMLRRDDSEIIPDIREERRRAILGHIDAHLADPGLDVASIARAFGFSSRTVHKLFEGEAHTVARTIWDRRLERCREEMVDPGLAARSITEIAHFWGFSDSQHFSRAFRQRYGLTPREYRNMFPVH